MSAQPSPARSDLRRPHPPRADRRPEPGAQSTFPLTGPLSVGDLLDRAFRLYRARFGLFLLTAAVFTVPVAILSGLFMGSFFGNYMRAIELLMREPPGPDFNPFPFLFDLFGGFYGGMLLLTLLSAAAAAIVNLSLTAQSIEALHGGSLSLTAGIRRGLRRFWPYIGMMIVQWAAIFVATVAVMAPLLLAVIALVAGGVLFGENLWDTGEATGIISAVGIVGLLLCGYILFLFLALIPLVYLSARWLVAPAALIAEGTGPISSLRRSWRLSRGNVLRMVGYVILLYLLLAVVLYLPAAALQWIVMILLPSGAFELMTGLSTAFSSFFSIIGAPFYIGAVTLLYYDLRIRGESYDLELRIVDMEKRVTPGIVEKED